MRKNAETNKQTNKHVFFQSSIPTKAKLKKMLPSNLPDFYFAKEEEKGRKEKKSVSNNF
jgi:hypothetical protein